ncbi:response regulator [Granulicella paludicola]|uniref:response regulator n=1 Tax=Granulicella paludicola TaxID=474951 RepID=UPI0021DF814D|nr:response regulator [Granulicella paludicola]
MNKAMVIDDSRPVRMILTRMLTELGYEVSQAGNGREALDLVEQTEGTPSLILVDWNMPEMNGLEFIRHFRAQQRFSRVPLIMVTTETEIGHVQLALEAGANEYVMKPFTKEAVLEKIQMMSQQG